MRAWVLPFSELARKPALLGRSSSMQPRRTSHARSFSSTRLWPSTAQLCTRPFSAFGLKGSRQFVPLQLIDARHLSARFVVDGLQPTWEVQRTWESAGLLWLAWCSLLADCGLTLEMEMAEGIISLAGSRVETVCHTRPPCV